MPTGASSEDVTLTEEILALAELIASAALVRNTLSTKVRMDLRNCRFPWLTIGVGAGQLGFVTNLVAGGGEETMPNQWQAATVARARSILCDVVPDNQAIT